MYQNNCCFFLKAWIATTCHYIWAANCNVMKTQALYLKAMLILLISMSGFNKASSLFSYHIISSEVWLLSRDKPKLFFLCLVLLFECQSPCLTPPCWMSASVCFLNLEGSDFYLGTILTIYSLRKNVFCLKMANVSTGHFEHWYQIHC